MQCATLPSLRSSVVFQKARGNAPQFPSIVSHRPGGDERRAGSDPYGPLFAQCGPGGPAPDQPRGETYRTEAFARRFSICLPSAFGHALSAGQGLYLMEDLKARAFPIELTSPRMSHESARPMAPPCAATSYAGLASSRSTSDDPAFFAPTWPTSSLLAHPSRALPARNWPLAANPCAQLLPARKKLSGRPNRHPQTKMPSLVSNHTAGGKNRKLGYHGCVRRLSAMSANRTLTIVEETTPKEKCEGRTCA